MCHRDVLTRAGACTVERCSCGAVHLTVGALTLRLGRSDFEAVSSAVAGAACLMSGQDGTERPAGGRLAAFFDDAAPGSAGSIGGDL